MHDSFRYDDVTTHDSFRYDDVTRPNDCSPAIVLAKLLVRQREAARADGLDPNVTAKSYI